MMERSETAGSNSQTPEASSEMAETCAETTETHAQMIETPSLFTACREGDEELAQRMLDEGADLQEETVEGETALHEASWHGHVKVVDFLLRMRARPDAQTENGDTPLHKAAENGKEDVVCALLKLGPDLKLTNDYGSTPLHDAAEKGHMELVKMLLDENADPNARNGFGFTPVHIAARDGFADCHGQLVQLLLDKDANVHAATRNGKTLFHYAIDEGDSKWLAHLIKHAARLVEPESVEQGTLIHWAVAGKRTSVLDLLLKRGDKPNVRDSFGQTALHWASTRGYRDMVKSLLDNKADPSVTDKTKSTAADLAKEMHRPLCLALLDKQFAQEQGVKLKEEFDNALLIHVISTRYNPPLRDGIEQSEDPKVLATDVKEKLEENTLEIRVFNPNFDNAFLMSGDPAEANAIWLKNFREVGLEGARRTGGVCIQVIPKFFDGKFQLSKMQEAEADMAHDKGVPVVRLDENIDVFDKLPEWDALVETAKGVCKSQSRKPPYPARDELEKELKDAKAELNALRERVATLEHGQALRI